MQREDNTRAITRISMDKSVLHLRRGWFMKRVLRLLGVSLLISSLSAAQQKPAQPKKSPTAAAAGETRGDVHNDAAGGGSEAAAKLPVRRVVLYKNGVGYFEHLGRVRGNQDVHIDFTSAQLNDVLKSLTVLDLAGGRITGVDYNSEAPLARRLATLRLALGEKPTMAEFLGALRGSRIEVRSGTGTALTGKLLSVERKTRTGAGPGWTVETDEISLVTDGGEVRSVDLNSATSVRIAEKDLQVEVSRYLSLIASSRDQDVRRITISTTGTGERNLYVSYISEVPIWKTTYRIVLPTKPEKKPLLQGWAIVDNTVGEDWDNVELSLVAGAPHSFIQQLSEPFYGRRPVVPLPESIQLSPQTHMGTLSSGNGRLSGAVTDSMGAAIAGTIVQLQDENGGVVAQTTSDSNGQYSFSSLAPGLYKALALSQGFKTLSVSQLNIAPGENQLNAKLELGTSTETVTVTSSGPTIQTSQAMIASTNGNLGRVAKRAHVSDYPLNGRNFGAIASLSPGVAVGAGGGFAPSAASLEEAREMGEAAASGRELGDLFEYKLKDRVTLKKNQSALVPIAQTEMEAEKVSIWSGTSGSGRPLRGLWLKNTSALTLDGGSFSVLENEVFAGEGLTDSIKPGERRLLSFATDLGLLVEAQTNSQPQHVTRVKISKGTLTQISELHERTLYTVRNQDAGTRTLVIEHPARPEWRLAKGAKEPEEKAPGTYRFKMEVPSKATASLPVEEARILASSYQLSTLEEDNIAVFVKNGTITPEMAQALGKITAQKAVVAKLEEEMENRQKDIDRIVEDQGRLRENMKALRGSAEEKALLQRYTKQLDEQETQLDVLRKKIQDTEAQRDKANDELEKMIEGLDLEATL
jgi:hypothetical protein